MQAGCNHLFKFKNPNIHHLTFLMAKTRRHGTDLHGNKQELTQRTSRGFRTNSGAFNKGVGCSNTDCLIKVKAASIGTVRAKRSTHPINIEAAQDLR